MNIFTKSPKKILLWHSIDYDAEKCESKPDKSNPGFYGFMVLWRIMITDDEYLMMTNQEDVFMLDDDEDWPHDDLHDRNIFFWVRRITDCPCHMCSSHLTEANPGNPKGKSLQPVDLLRNTSSRQTESRPPPPHAQLNPMWDTMREAIGEDAFPPDMQLSPY